MGLGEGDHDEKRNHPEGWEGHAKGWRGPSEGMLSGLGHAEG